MAGEGTGAPTNLVDVLLRSSVCFLLIVVVYSLTLRDSTAGDPLFGPITASSLLREGNIDLDEYESADMLHHPLVLENSDRAPETAFLDASALDRVRAQDDVHVYDYFPWTTALFAVPAAAIAELTNQGDGPVSPDDPQLGRLHIITASLLVALAAMVLRATVLLLVGGSPRRRQAIATATALVFAFGTSAWSTASRALSQHTPSLLFASLLVYLAVAFDREAGRPAERWSPRLGGAVFGATAAASAIVRPPNLFLGAALLLWLILRDRERRVAAVAAALATGAAFLVANLALLGEVLPPYYSGSRFSFHDELAEAIAANVVSPSRGLLVASPILIVGVVGGARMWKHPARRPLLAALVFPIVALTVSVSGLADNWWAGASIGPRFMTDVLPEIVILGALGLDTLLDGDRTASQRRAALGVVSVLTLWSVTYHAVGANSSVSACWTTQPTYIDEHPERVWSISDSQMGRPIGMMLRGDAVAAITDTC